MRAFKPGDIVVFRKPKVSTSPGPRAKEIDAAVHGDLYTYTVDKFWVVSETRDDGQLVVRTRRGKEHIVPVDDPRLRRPRWWERLLYRSRFPAPEE